MDDTTWTPSRRQVVGGAVSVAAASLTLGSQPAWATVGHRPARLPAGVFTLGVASGEPDHHSVVLWTRLAPDPLHGGGMPPEDVTVRYEVASDEAFRRPVHRGRTVAKARWGHSVHVTVEGLRPDRWYWYRFVADGQVSPVGRARTAPAGRRGDGLRFLFASCQNWQGGFYSAWEHAPAEDPDLVVHLGDYIYEGGISTGAPRQHNSATITTLDGYRNRYGLYKGDPALQAAHAACPWIITWDDHEVANNYAGPLPQNPAEAPTFAARRAAAYQAWWEHTATRLRPPSDENLRIYRSHDWGRLARFHVLDTRQYRSDQACGEGLGPDCADRHDPARTILGAEQEAWVSRSLRRSRATWDVLANQVVMTSLPVLGSLYNPDAWDGYAAARTRMLDQIRASGSENAVVLTGDIHASGVGDLVDEGPGAQPVGVELVGTSISSTFSAAPPEIAEEIIGQIPHVRWFNVRQRGYVRCDVSPDALVAQFRVVDSVAVPSSPMSTIRSWTVEAGHVGVEPT